MEQVVPIKSRRKAKTTPLVEKISRVVQRDIVEQGFGVGEKLPTVTAWATKLSVSDRTVQQAMAHLKDQGILSCHVGKGTFLNRIPKVPESRLQEAFGGYARPVKNVIAVLDGQSEVDLTCDHTESWTTRIVHGMRVEAARNNVDLLLLSDPVKKDSLAKRLEDISDKVDGIITFPFADDYSLSQLFDTCPVPVLTVNRPSEESRENYVSADYFSGSKLVGQLFAKLECKSICFVSTQIAGVHSKEQRYHGLVEGLKMAGSHANIDVILVDAANDAEGYRVMRRKFDEGYIPQGVYCSGDYLALGVVRAAKECGLAIGTKEGINIIGSTGVELAAHSEPPLSVVQIPMIEMGRCAVRKLLEIRNTDKIKIEGLMLPTQLVLRSTTPHYLIEEGWLDKISQARQQVDI